MRVLAFVLVAAAATGCGAGRAAKQLPTEVPRQSPAPQESLSSFIEKTRELQARAAAQPVRVLGSTLESVDAELGAALAEAQLRPTAAAERRVADAYARHGIFDMAHQYLMSAVKGDPRDAANYEALARLWRDAGMAHLGMGDAHRAVYYAPKWSVAHNTLGTIYQALGQKKAARSEYETALNLEPHAAYVLNNLCYSDILDGRMTSAVDRCNAALSHDPQLRAAQNNLGIAYAAIGKMDAAMAAFNAGADRADALYNLGIVRVARKEYRSAVEAFQAAQAAKPSFALAAARVEQARAHLGSGEK
jgi:Flp pilus assembly protein TadD